MLLQPPNLDDRTWDQLVAEQLARVRELCPTWTDLSPGDPGRVLLELYAYLTETMIYRLNRLPDKAFVEFLRLIDVRLRPPIAAAVTLRFSRARPDPQPLAIPRGTRVSLSRTDGGGQPPVFTTDAAAEIPAGQTEVPVQAHHCDLIQGELVGTGTGLPGLSVVARRPPFVAPTGAEGDLIVGVEATSGELGDRVPQISFEGKTYRVWSEVDNFADSGQDDPVYVVDRVSGTVTFAPAVQMSQDGAAATTQPQSPQSLAPRQAQSRDGALATTPPALGAIPAAGREIRLWYRRGGGPDGNVAANQLTVLKDQIAGVQVTNPAPATGGQAAEDLANAKVRGPQDLHSLKRAVTQHDFEQIAASQGVARAYAYTRAAFWKHAAPGTVEVLLVPQLSSTEMGGGPVTVAMLEQDETDPIKAQVARVLDERRPLGTTCLVNWARYKTVHVSARIVVFREEDKDAVKGRVLRALYQTINPLPTSMSSTGWPFGQALHVSDVYDVALREPGAHFVDRVKLLVDEVPDKAVLTIAADQFQPNTWHAGSSSALFRSLDDGEGWERTGNFPEGQIGVIRPHPDRPGMLGLVVQLADGKGSRLYTSVDCAETWPFLVETAFVVQHFAWLDRDGHPLLLLATDQGLFEQELEPGKGPIQVAVDAQAPNQGFYSIAVSRSVRGIVSVALAAQNVGGVYLSKDGGRTYVKTGLQNHDVRRLAIQYSGVQAFLWAGTFAAGEGATGEGCFRWELLGAGNPQDGWQTWGKGWKGGSCLSMTFAGSQVLCGSHHAGVLRIDPSAPNPQWLASDLRSGLPLRDTAQFTFEPIPAIAANPNGQLVMVGGQEGVFRSHDGGITFEPSSRKEFTDKVTLPGTWLFCSGEHDVTVVSEDEAQRG